MPCVLITGVAPLTGELTNPMWQAVTKLDEHLIAKHRVIALELPYEFDRSLALLYEAIEQHHPILVLCVGQAVGRCEINIERVAININDAHVQDNAAEQPIDQSVIENAPAAYFTNLPIKRILHALRQSEIPAVISNTAGTYICNHVMYGLLHHINQHEPHIKGGFIHIPYLPSQAVHHNGAPSMSENTVLSALKVIINEAISAKEGIKVAAGTTH